MLRGVRKILTQGFDGSESCCLPFKRDFEVAKAIPWQGWQLIVHAVQRQVNAGLSPRVFY